MSVLSVVSTETTVITSAEPTEDFVFRQETVTFGRDSSREYVYIDIVNDNIPEPATETFNVVLGNPTNGELGSPSEVTVRIQNDDGMFGKLCVFRGYV